MSEPTREELDEVRARLAELKPLLEKVGVEPVVTQAPVEHKTVVSSYEEMVRLRREFLSWNTNDLHRAIAIQLAKGTNEGLGIPLTKWADSRAMEAMVSQPDITKLLDTAGAGPLIRQDLEPLLYAAFVKRFPLYERIAKKPANGLVHAYNRIDAPAAASFISDAGAVPDSQSTYTRATTNIAVIAVRVGVGLKASFAIRQGGMGWNPEQTEIANGILGIAKACQRALFSGNVSVPGKIATDPEGLYDANAFDGLRITVPSGNTSTIGDDETVLEGLNRMDGILGVRGGTASIICMDGRDRVRVMNELQPNVRFVDRMDVVPGLPAFEAVSLGVSGRVPILPIPGDEVGHYTAGVDVRDAYLLDESVVAMPWLGSENPTVLEIPVGVSGTLDRRYILFLMVGLEVAVPNFVAKLRLPTA